MRGLLVTLKVETSELDSPYELKLTSPRARYCFEDLDTLLAVLERRARRQDAQNTAQEETHAEPV